MSENPDGCVCPFCGADPEDGIYPVWTCKTSYFGASVNQKPQQSDRCRLTVAERERDAARADLAAITTVTCAVCGKRPSAVVREIIALEAENAKLREDRDRWHEVVKNDCENEELVKDEARKVLTPLQVDGDQYMVPSVATIAESLVERVQAAEKERDEMREALAGVLERYAFAPARALLAKYPDPGAKP